MSKIDRLYCTHCTFGTSALESHTPENADKVLGYSVRASSVSDVDRGRLEQLFSAVERRLLYELPRDTPTGKKETLDAATAPRRLTFLPNLGGFQIVGQISYRSRDTAGRPGSYFADVIVGEVARTGAGKVGQGQQPVDCRWSPTECLRLWSANHEGEPQGDWWCDSEEELAAQAAKGRVTPAVPDGELADLRGNAPACVGDAELWSFLNTPPNGIFDDRGRIIPPRWREIPIEDRRSLVASLLQATIDLLKNRGRGSVVLAAEPSVAALVFYGVYRLLPEALTLHSDQVPGLSFSTYEQFPERPMTNLVATTFFDIDNPANDLPAEVYQRGFACNTFRQPFKYGKTQPVGPYACHAIRLATDSPAVLLESVDDLLKAINGLANINETMLDRLVEIDQCVSQYTHGAQPAASIPRFVKFPNVGGEADFWCNRFSVLVKAAASQGRSQWPPDLLERAIEWLGDKLVDEHGLWSGSHPGCYRLLSGMLPTTEHALKRFLSANYGRQPPDLVATEAFVKVSQTIGRLPESLDAFLASKEKAGRAAESRRFFEGLVASFDPHLLTDILLRSDSGVYASRILSAIAGSECRIQKGATDAILDQLLETSVERSRVWSLLAAHPEIISRIQKPISSKLQDKLNRIFDGDAKNPGLRNAPPAVMDSESLEGLRHWAKLTAKFSDNDKLLTSWRECLRRLQKLTESAKAQSSKRLRWGASKAPSEEMAAVGESLCEIKGLRSVAELTEPLARQCLDLFRAAMRNGKSGVSAETSKQLDGWVRLHLDQLTAQAKRTAPSPAATTAKRPDLASLSVTHIALLGGLGVLVASGCLATAAYVLGWHPIPKTKEPQTKIATPKTRSLPSGVSEVSKPPPVTSRSEGEQAAASKTDPSPIRENPNPPTPATKSELAQSLKPEDIRLECTIKEGELCVSWDPQVATEGTCELRIIFPNRSGDKVQQPIPSNPTPPIIIPLHNLHEYGYGSYQVTCEFKPSSGHPIRATAQAFLPQPEPPEIESLDVEINSERAVREIVARLSGNKTPAGCEQSKYVLRITGKEQPQATRAAARVIPVPDQGQELRFPMPSELLPEHFLEGKDLPVTFELLIDAQAGEGKPSKAMAANTVTHSEIAEFMKQQVASKTYKGVPGVFPLSRAPLAEDSSAVSLVPLHPFLSDDRIELLLLAPRGFGISRTLKLKREGTSSLWRCIEEPGSGTQPADLDPPPSIECGAFTVDNRDPWKPVLLFTTKGTDESSRAARTRLSYCKLGVFYKPQSVKKEIQPLAIIQLLEPQEPKTPRANKLKLISSNAGRSVATDLLFQNLPHSPKHCVFHNPPPSSYGRLTVSATNMTIVIAMENTIVAKAAVEIKASEGKLTVKPFRWTRDAADHKSVPEFPSKVQADSPVDFRMEDAISAGVIKKGFSKIAEQTIPEDFVKDVLDLGKPGPATAKSPKQLLEQLEAEKRSLDEKRKDYKEYAQYVDKCIKLAKDLRVKSEWQVSFASEVEKAIFNFAPWSIGWEVELPGACEITHADEDFRDVGGRVVKAVVCDVEDAGLLRRQGDAAAGAEQEQATQ
jgi:hypothetical protein